MGRLLRVILVLLLAIPAQGRTVGGDRTASFASTLDRTTSARIGRSITRSGLAQRRESLIREMSQPGGRTQARIDELQKLDDDIAKLDAQDFSDQVANDRNQQGCRQSCGGGSSCQSKCSGGHGKEVDPKTIAIAAVLGAGAVAGLAAGLIGSVPSGPSAPPAQPQTNWAQIQKDSDERRALQTEIARLEDAKEARQEAQRKFFSQVVQSQVKQANEQEAARKKQEDAIAQLVSSAQTKASSATSSTDICTLEPDKPECLRATNNLRLQTSRNVVAPVSGVRKKLFDSVKPNFSVSQEASFVPSSIGQ